MVPLQRMKQPRGVIALLAFGLGLAGARSARAASPLRVERAGGDVFLVRGTSRLRLSGDERIALASGYQISLPGGEVSWTAQEKAEIRSWKAGKPDGRLRVQEVVERWLTQDEIWGGHAHANEHRYLANEGGGVFGMLVNPVPRGDALLAVLRLHAAALSMQPVVVDLLVRVRVQPRLALEFLRRLGSPVDSDRGTWSRQAVRIIVTGRKLLLYLSPPPPDTQVKSPARLMEVTGDGNDIRLYMELPVLKKPVGLLGKRWLILGEMSDGDVADPMWVFDLWRKTLTPLPGNWRGGDSPDAVSVPAEGNRLLIRRGHWEGSRWLTEVFVVTLPAGERLMFTLAPEDNGILHLWQDMVVSVGMKAVVAYSASTGKRIQRLTLE